MGNICSKHHADAKFQPDLQLNPFRHTCAVSSMDIRAIAIPIVLILFAGSGRAQGVPEFAQLRTYECSAPDSCVPVDDAIGFAMTLFRACHPLIRNPHTASVRLRVSFRTDGSVRDKEILESFPRREFDDLALELVDDVSLDVESLEELAPGSWIADQVILLFIAHWTGPHCGPPPALVQSR